MAWVGRELSVGPPYKGVDRAGTNAGEVPEQSNKQAGSVYRKLSRFYSEPIPSDLY